MTENELLDAVRSIPENALISVFDAYTNVLKDRWASASDKEARETAYGNLAGSRSFMAFIAQKRSELRKLVLQPKNVKVP